MLYYYYYRIYLSKELALIKHVHEKSAIFHYWYFLDKWFKFQGYICNRSYEILMLSTNLNDSAILIVNYADYRCYFTKISKLYPLNLLKKLWFDQQKMSNIKIKNLYKTLSPYVKQINKL